MSVVIQSAAVSNPVPKPVVYIRTCVLLVLAIVATTYKHNYHTACCNVCDLVGSILFGSRR